MTCFQSIAASMRERMAILPARALPGGGGSAHLWLATPNDEGNPRAAPTFTEDQSMCRRVRLAIRLGVGYAKSGKLVALLLDHLIGA
jgi:hypothetical protein